VTARASLCAQVDRLLIRLFAFTSVDIAPADPLRVVQQRLGNLLGMNQAIGFALCLKPTP
jgi:hypothetical protein